MGLFFNCLVHDRVNFTMQGATGPVGPPGPPGSAGATVSFC